MHLSRRAQQAGFTLVEVLVSVLVSSLVLGAVVALSTNVMGALKNQSEFKQSLQTKWVLQLLARNEAAWANTVNYASNTNLRCLAQGTTCKDGSGNPATGPFVLLDQTNNVHPQTRACTAPNCPPDSYSLTWTAICPSGTDPSDPNCVKPQIKIVATPNNPSITINAFTVYRNYSTAHFVSCQKILDVFTAGGADAPSQFYFIDPDTTGSIVPFQVYCSMVDDGGGWALVANATPGYTAKLPIGTLVSEADTARLSDSQITAMIRASVDPGNNVKVEVDTSVGTYTLPFKVTTGNPLVGAYLINTPAEACGTFAATPTYAASQTNHPNWWFADGDTTTGYVGFVDGDVLFPTSLGTGYGGFVCNSCTGVAGCGMPSGKCCERGLSGSIWVR